MEFPKPTDENIALTGADLKDTENLKDITETISKKIADEENDISNFYRYFEELKNWIEQNQGLIPSSRGLLIERVHVLQAHLKRTQEIVSDIKVMTKDEEKLDSQKIMRTEKIGSDFSQEQNFARQLKFPRGVIKLAKRIADQLRQQGDQTKIDLDVEKKTVDLLDNIGAMLDNVQVKLDEFEKYLADNPDLHDMLARFQVLVDDIATEKQAFDKLSNFEQIHLNLLLELNQKESAIIREESEFKKDEEKQEYSD